MRKKFNYNTNIYIYREREKDMLQLLYQPPDVFYGYAEVGKVVIIGSLNVWS